MGKSKMHTTTGRTRPAKYTRHGLNYEIEIVDSKGNTQWVSESDIGVSADLVKTAAANAAARAARSACKYAKPQG